MRALVVAPQPFFSPRGTPFSVYYRTLVMAQAGVAIDLLTYGQGQDVDLEGVRIIRIPAFRFLGPVKVGPSLLKLFLDGFVLLWTIALLIARRYDLVHAHEESVFFCRFLKPIFRFKLVYDMHSSLPQQLSNFRFTRSSLLISLFEQLEHSCLKAADAVITISPAVADVALAHMPDPARHFLIENSIVEPVRLKGGESDGEPTGQWDKELPPGRSLIAYAGTFESYQGLEILIGAFARVAASRPDSFLLAIGGSAAQVTHYRALASKLGVERNCLFTGQLPQSAARSLLEKATIVTSPRSEGTNTPLKIYELMARGKPLVATRILSHTQVLSDRECFLAAPEPAAFAAALLTALGDEHRRREVADAARKLYDDRYSRQAYTAKVRRLLEVVS